MPGSRRAVLVGINSYDDQRIPTLKGAFNDASEFYNRLKESGDFNEITLLTDNKDTTCRSIRKAVSDLLWQPDEAELCLFYFSGHGFQDGYGNGYLASVDIAPDEPLVCGIRMQELRELVLASKNKSSILMILDCCYSGTAADIGGKGEPLAPLPAGEEPHVSHWFSSVNEAQKDRGLGKMIFASSAKDQKSHEIQRAHDIGEDEIHDHGAFTFVLLEGLDGKAAANDDRVTAAGLRNYLEEQMKSDPQHKFSWFGSAVSDSGDIFIAAASQRAKLNSMRVQIEGYLQKGDPTNVFKAVPTLQSMLNISAKAAPDLKAKMDEMLNSYELSANKWLISNDAPDGAEGIWCFFENSFRHFGMETILRETSTNRNLLKNVIRASIGDLDCAIFLNQLRSVTTRSTQQPAQNVLTQAATV